MVLPEVEAQKVKRRFAQHMLSTLTERKPYQFWLFIFLFVIVSVGLGLKVINNNDHEVLVNDNSPSQLPQDTIHTTPNPPKQSDDLKQEYARINTHADGLQRIERPELELDVNLAELIDELTYLAESGENTAAYILAMNLRKCYGSPVNEEELDTKLEEADYFDERGNRAAGILSKYENCLDIDESERSKFYHFLALAAQRGYVPAQEMIANITPQQYMEVSGYKNAVREQFVQKRDEFLAQQHNYLQSAANNGSIRALIKLSQLEYAQRYGDNGRLKAYAYNQVILELTDDNELYNRYAWFQQQMDATLSAEEIDQVMTMAQQLLASIQAHGTIYSQ